MQTHWSLIYYPRFTFDAVTRLDETLSDLEKQHQRQQEQNKSEGKEKLFPSQAWKNGKNILVCNNDRNDDDRDNADELHTLQCQAAAANGPSMLHNAAVITGYVLIINP